MGIENLGAKIISDLVPRFRAVGEKRLDGAAAKLAPDLLTLDREALDKLDRSAVELVAKLDKDLRESNPEALATKYSNMAKSPGRFLTGQPEVMAFDMQDIARKLGADTVVTGDMHMRNLGTVLKANGKIRRRFNDFDVATVGPAALDFNRMATSIVLHAREQSYGKGHTRKLVERFANAYYETMEKLAKHPGEKVKVKSPRVVTEQIEKVEGRDPEKWLEANAPTRHGQHALPRNSWKLEVTPKQKADVTQAIDRYRMSLPKAGRDQLDGYRVTDVINVVSGTGSIGQDRFHVLLEGGKKDTPIILQLKAQGPSAYDPFVKPKVKFPSPAARNVALSDLMNGGLDSLRGVARLPGASEDMLVERLGPHRNTLDVDKIHDFKDLSDLVEFDGAQAAKGHARGGSAGLAGAPEILKTLGSQEDFVSGLVDFSHRYADQTELDHAAFVKALKHDPLLSRVGKPE